MKEREEKKKELESLLIVVDMINGFIKEGKMADPYISHIIPGIKDLVERNLEEGSGVAFIKDAHNDNAEEFKKFLGEENMEKIPLEKEDTIPNIAKSMIDAIKILTGGD